MQKGKKTLLTLGLSFSVLIAAQSTTIKANPTFAYKMSGGVNNSTARKYYVDDAIGFNYYTDIDDAMDSWMDTSSRLGVSKPVNFSESPSFTTGSTAIAVYQKNVPTLSANGWTEFYGLNGATGSYFSVDPDSRNWDMCKVYIETYHFSSLSDDVQDSVIAHELDHCFGLDENNSNTKSIMCQHASGRSVNKPQKTDVSAVKSIY